MNAFARLLTRRYLTKWLEAFVLTQAIEMPIYARSMPDRPWRERLAVGFAASAITHPFVWFFFPVVLRGTSYDTQLAVSESFAVVVEALWLRYRNVPDPILWSLVANGTSASIGLVLSWAFGWFG